MPFLELLYLNKENEQSSVFVKVDDYQNIPTTFTVDSVVLNPKVTFVGDKPVSVCNIPQSVNITNLVIRAKVDMYVVDPVEPQEEEPVDDESDTESVYSEVSDDSETTDCTIEPLDIFHTPPNAVTQEFLAKLADKLEFYGACLTSFRGYNAQDLFRFEFNGSPAIVSASVLLFRKFAEELCSGYDFDICFGFPEHDVDLPWCRLQYEIPHEQVANEAIISQRLSDTHIELLETYPYMYQETALTDLSVSDGYIVDSRYLATENPWEVLSTLFTHMLPPVPREVAESKEES